jgi:S1-C subfamily serine protease
VTEQPTPADNGKHDDDAQARPDGVIHSMSGQPDMSQRNLQAPVEQPYYVPTAQQQAHQQAWSTAQQYQFHPQGTQAPYGQPQQAPAGYPYGQYGQHPQYGGSGQLPPYGPYGGVGFWTPPPVPKKSRPHKMLYGSVAAAVATALAVGGVALAVDHANNGSSQQTALNTPAQTNPFSQNGGGTGTFGFGNGSGSDGSSGSGSDGSSGSTGSTGATGTATSTQSVGIVDINTTLDFGEGKAAGTGMVLTSDGEILTNNHVVEDSTAISVVVVSTGKTYTATVVGTDPTDDVAVIQLKDASGLATAKLGDSSTVKAGTAVTAVGNAGGTGGTPTSASGSVTAINQSITASDESGANAEKLTGMIEVNANIQAGDSGGALYEDASGTIVGMNTAASSSSASRFGASTATTGFAIPIAKATGIAKQIESGPETSTIHLGYPAFFGVQLSATGQSTTAGATISGVVKGSAAAAAGLAAGDTITAVDGKAIASATALSAVTATHKPGDKVSVTFTNTAGKSQSVTVTLGQGPAD